MQRIKKGLVELSYQTKITLGDNVEEAEQNAKQLASDFYAQVPINDARGQTFKNTFVEALFQRSERSRRMGSYLTNGSKGSAPKPVIGPAYLPKPTKAETAAGQPESVKPNLSSDQVAEYGARISSLESELNNLKILIADAGDILAEADN